MAGRLGSANICITQLRDGFSSAVVTLYRESASSEKPLRLLYTFSSGELASGVDGKTLSECLNGWSTERSATTHYAISASVRSDGEIGEILPSSWSDSYLVAEKGETIVSVTLYQRAIESPERPTTAITYNFYTGAVTGGLGAWNASIPEWGTAPLWSISAVASAVLSEGVESDEISASEWSAPKKVAENGESPVEIYFSTYSWLFPADSDGLVSAEEYAKFQVDVNAVKGNSAVEVALSCELTGITNITVSGNSIVGSEKSVMLGDSASVKVSVVVEGVTYSRMITLAKAKQSKSATLYFAWSKSESIFTPKDSNFWIMGTSFIFFNNSLMGNIPFTSSWVDNWEEIQSAKTDEYCYLWCKTSEDGTPFLFTGATGKTGAYTIYRYALSTSGTTAPTDGWTDTLPTITTDSPYLWIKAGKVVAGGSDSDATWSDATLLGTDSSQVYAKIEEEAEARKLAITNLSATGGAIESKIESYKIDSEGHTLSQAGTLIQQTEDRIALKVVSGSSSGEVADSSGKTVTGITIVDGTIQLNAQQTIATGTVTANEVSATELLKGKSFVVGTGGSIESESHKADSTKGFKIWDSGHIDAYDINLGGDVVFGGTVQNDVITTRKEAVEGKKYKMKDGVYEYYKAEDVLSFLKNNATALAECTADNISSSPVFTNNGTNYYAVANITPAKNVIFTKSNSTWTAQKESNFNWTSSSESISFTVDSACTLTIDFDLLWVAYYSQTSEGLAHTYYTTADSSYSYVIDDTEKYIDIPSNKRKGTNIESEITQISHQFTISFNEAGSHIIYLKCEYSFAYDNYGGVDDSVSYALSASLTSSISGYYAFVTPYSYKAISEIYTAWENYFNASNVSFSYDTSSLPKYSLFKGMQSTMGDTYSDDSTSFVGNSDNVVIDGVAQSGTAVVSYSESTGLTVTVGGVVTQILPYTYYSSYPVITFTLITEGIGVYVSDLLPKENGVSNIGAEGEQKFNSVYATNLYGTLNGDSSGTHIGNVNSDSTKNDYQVWGAVFN